MRPELSLTSSFNDFFKPWNGWLDDGVWEKSLKVPAVNISEHDNDYTVSVAAPGLKKEDFKIEVEGNMLTISAQKEERKEEKEEKYSRKEYNYSSFSRSFTLPDEVKQDKIEASYENGVLKLVLPKNAVSKQSSVKTIQVK
jgi:HSP20 family protein